MLSFLLCLVESKHIYKSEMHWASRAGNTDYVNRQHWCFRTDLAKALDQGRSSSVKWVSPS